MTRNYVRTNITPGGNGRISITPGDNERANITPRDNGRTNVYLKTMEGKY
jgi:hypothetical protein